MSQAVLCLNRTINLLLEWWPKFQIVAKAKSRNGERRDMKMCQRYFCPAVYTTKPKQTKKLTLILDLQSIPRESNNKDVAAMLVELTIEANEESFVIVHQHGGNDVTCKSRILTLTLTL